MVKNIGLTAAFPQGTEAFKEYSDAVYNQATEVIDGDIIESAHKNHLDDTLYAIKTQLSLSPEVYSATGDLRTYGMTYLLRNAIPTTQLYRINIPERVANFLGLENLKMTTAPQTAVISSVRPYYAGLSASQLTAVKALWTAARAQTDMVHQFKLYWNDETIDPQLLYLKFTPPGAVTSLSEWAAASNYLHFIVSIIISTYKGIPI